MMADHQAKHGITEKLHPFRCPAVPVSLSLPQGGMRQGPPEEGPVAELETDGSGKACKTVLPVPRWRPFSSGFVLLHDHTGIVSAEPNELEIA
jgi:hypothetical protein